MFWEFYFFDCVRKNDVYVLIIYNNRRIVQTCTTSCITTRTSLKRFGIVHKNSTKRPDGLARGYDVETLSSTITVVFRIAPYGNAVYCSTVGTSCFDLFCCLRGQKKKKINNSPVSPNVSSLLALVKNKLRCI